jgi:predicted Zn-dependent protease with MMP-like domain
MSVEDFEDAVAEALDSLPPSLATRMDNIVVLVDEENVDEPDLLGLYEGIPLTERDGWYAGVLPDRITVYRRPTVERWDTRAQVVDDVRVTVVHEIAHHFGIDDARLHDLGYG